MPVTNGCFEDTLISSTFRIDALTNCDDNYWRIDWFGYLRYFDDTGIRRSEPLVDVFLSAFKSAPTSDSLNYKRSTAYDQARCVQVPISYLRLLRLGDVWHKGSRVEVPRAKSMLATFRNIDINQHTTQTLRASSKNEHGSYILPFSYHPYHMKATQTYCEVIKLAGDRTLIVPHYVLLQAYFARSQYVFQQLFKFGIDFESIYDPSKSYLTPDGAAFVLLKKWTHDVAATEVARMAFDAIAQSAVKSMSQQFAVQQANGEPVRPKTSFPFEGRTTLKVFGKWCPLNSGKNSHQVFVVFDILSCSAQYPFNKLEYFRDNPGDKLKSQGSSKRKDNSGSNYQKPKPKVSSSLEIEAMPDQEPSNRLDELELEARQGTVFHDLAGKPIEKKRAQPHKDLLNNQVSLNIEDVQQGNTGEGDSRSVVAPVDFQLPRTDYEDKFIFKTRICRLKLFLEVIEKISLSPTIISLEFLQLFQNAGDSNVRYSRFPTQYLKSGRPTTWQYINYFKGSLTDSLQRFQYRKALVVKLELANGNSVYLIEAERRIIPVYEGWVELDTTAIFLAIVKQPGSISKYQLCQLLKSCSVLRGTWDKQILTVAESNPIKHPANSAVESGNYVDRQIKILERHLGLLLN